MKKGKLNKLQKLSRQIARLQSEFLRLKQEAARRNDGTVIAYETRITEVRAHERRGYKAIRIRS